MSKFIEEPVKVWRVSFPLHNPDYTYFTSAVNKLTALRNIVFRKNHNFIYDRRNFSTGKRKRVLYSLLRNRNDFSAVVIEHKPIEIQMSTTDSVSKLSHKEIQLTLFYKET